MPQNFLKFVGNFYSTFTFIVLAFFGSPRLAQTRHFAVRAKVAGSNRLNPIHTELCSTYSYRGGGPRRPIDTF